MLVNFYRLVIVFLLIAIQVVAFAQVKSTQLEFILNQDTYFKQQVDLSTFKFYISSVSFYKSGELVYQEPNSYHLIDLSDTSSKTLNFPTVVDFDHISFSLGIDSLKNVSGVFGGDLDPTNGMYWTWQSGYINFKIEGNYKASKDEFTYHIGGYMPPFASIQPIQLEAQPLNNKVVVRIDSNEIVNLLKKQKLKNVMRPSKEAVEIAQVVASCFYVK